MKMNIKLMIQLIIVLANLDFFKNNKILLNAYHVVTHVNNVKKQNLIVPLAILIEYLIQNLVNACVNKVHLIKKMSFNANYAQIYVKFAKDRV
jgi:hypothetical protein